MSFHARDDALRLRRELVDVRKLCAALGLMKGAKPQARGLLVICPWHAEKHASCSVTLGPDGTVRVRCFTCQASGDALALIARVRELDIKRQFLNVLAEAARIAVSEPSARPELVREPVRLALDALSYNAVTARLLELCSLEREPDAVRYLERRKLFIAACHAGVSALPGRDMQETLLRALLLDFELRTLELSGLVNNGRFVHPFHRLLIPWRSPDGSIDLLQRRRVDEAEPRKKYVLPPGRSPLFPFGAEQIRVQTPGCTIALVEGALDVLALRILARRDGLAILPLGIPGVGNWRKEWAAFAKGRAVRIAFDSDAAGERNVATVARDLRDAGAVRVQRWTPAVAKDWAACLESGAA